MTILRPYKHYSIARFLVAFFAVVLVGGLIYIFEYNALVDARAETAQLKKQITTYQTDVATLKNDLYSMLDPVALQLLASQKGLVSEKRPQYITVVVQGNSSQEKP
ncbi:MAG: hypothetical protein Q7R98_00425 [Candidatus Jorgensenbacteria bacterium]|nr:hypothetical protein [Candidatus Jorgensenbacteria bacterium]